MLTSVTYQPSNLLGVFRSCDGIPNLEVCFALRCFQRLSHPYVATQQCHWRDNWFTRDTFTSVLSY